MRSNCGNVLLSEDMVFNFLKCSTNASRDNSSGGQEYKFLLKNARVQLAFVQT